MCSETRFNFMVFKTSLVFILFALMLFGNPPLSMANFGNESKLQIQVRYATLDSCSNFI